MQRHQLRGPSAAPFEHIPLDLTDLRLMVRQTADVLRRFGALDDGDYQLVQALGRDMKLLAVVRALVSQRRRARGGGAGRRGPAPGPTAAAASDAMSARARAGDAAVPVAMRRGAAAARRSSPLWTHPHCALCGGEPDLAVITPAAERHLICGRCTAALEVRVADLPVLPEQRSRADHVVRARADGSIASTRCDVCHRYLKAFDARRATRPVMPVVDGVATLPLDAAAMQRGYTS